jgi:hypothetical protein
MNEFMSLRVQIPGVRFCSAMLTLLVTLGLKGCASTSTSNPNPSTDQDSNLTSAPTDTASTDSARTANSPEPTSDSNPPPHEDGVPDFKNANFGVYPFQEIRPRVVEITVETSRTLSEEAKNREDILTSVRAGIIIALQRSNIRVAAQATNKMNFEIKDCRDAGDSAECVHIDVVLRTPRFELEVGGYSHNGYTSLGSASDPTSRGDLTRAYLGALNAVLERLNKQLEIVGMHQ